MFRKSRRGALTPDHPLRHPDHPLPVTRRQFIAQGLASGAATVIAPTVLGLFANPRAAEAALSADLEALKQSCGIAVQGAGRIPLICIDLAGGANMVGSNVLVGGRGGQLDFLSAAGYAKLGLPGDMVPGVANPGSATNEWFDDRIGLRFHSDSPFLRGILDRISVSTAAGIDGAVLPARSENDTGNNPHNPMYGIYRAGADGELLTLVGSRSSESGGNSMAPAGMVDAAVRPTKIDRTSDVTGLVDTGKLVGLLEQDDAVAVMESIQRLSDRKLARVDTGITRDDVIKELVRCNYVKAADLTDRYGDPSALNPELDPDIVGSGGIFSRAEFDADAEFRKTAAVMKMAGKLSDEAKRKVKLEYQAVMAGERNAGGLAVLDELVEKFDVLTIKPVDAQFLETLNATDAQIANFFGIPLYKINAGKQSYESNEQQNMDYLRTTLNPYLVQTEQGARLKWLTEKEQGDTYFRFNRDSLLQTDAKTRTEVLEKMVFMGAFTPNQVLQIVDQSPYDGGDVHYVPANMRTVEESGQEPGGRVSDPTCSLPRRPGDTGYHPRPPCPPGPTPRRGRGRSRTARGPRLPGPTHLRDGGAFEAARAPFAISWRRGSGSSRAG